MFQLSTNSYVIPPYFNALWYTSVSNTITFSKLTSDNSHVHLSRTNIEKVRTTKRYFFVSKQNEKENIGLRIMD